MAFTTVLKVLECGYRGYQVYNAGMQIYEDVQNEELDGVQRVGRVALNTLFIGAEVGAGVSLYRNSAPEIQFGWTVAAGAADVARNANRLYWKGKLNHGDYLDLLGVIAFRVSIVANNALILSRPVFGFNQNSLQTIESISAAAATIIQGRRGLSRVCSKAWNGIQSILEYCKGTNAHAEIELAVSINEQFEPTLVTDFDFAKLIREVTQAHSIDEFLTVPEIFRQDPILGQYRCALSLQPIRFLLLVRGSNGQTTYYEKNAILEFLPAGFEQLPSGWPTNVPFCRENLKESPLHQEQIDLCLNNLLQQYKRLPLDDLTTETFVQLAETIGISNTAISEKKLASAIKKSFSPEQAGKIGALSIFTTKHAFVPNSPKQETLVVRLQTRSYTEKTNLVLQNPKGLLRALLGSTRRSDKVAFDELINTPVQLNILMARDLRYHSVATEIKEHR